MPTDPRGFIGATAAAVMTAAGSTVRAASLPLPEYERLDATALADELRRGRITALEALDAAIARTEARSALNAVAARHFDAARETAKQLSALGRAERERRASAAPLLGVPFALKDLGVALQGTVTTNGCAFFRDAVAEGIAAAVVRFFAPEDP